MLERAVSERRIAVAVRVGKECILARRRVVAAGIIGLVVAISDAKAHHDQFEQSIDDLKKQEGN